MSDFDLDVNLPDFQAAVLDESRSRPVVVDFWAPWCGPCKSLKPILEKLAAEYSGKFRLVKVNADDNQALSQQYGVRGIPAVKAFVDGEMVDEFSGALPEADVRAFLDRLIPGPAEELRAQAAAARAAGDPSAALQLLADASKLDPQHVGIRLDAAEIMLDLKEADEAQRLLGSVADDADPRVAQLKARLQFLGAADADEAALQARIAADSNDLEARLALANLAIAGQRYEDGMEQLLEIVRRDRGFQDDIGRVTLLSVFNLLGGGELVSRYRRLLATTLN
ncbi:MAG TPA: thioredoxin [Thiobacillus sp.]|nr:MAG: thioredoxin [Hydrogenophilales bacterium 28-61-11]OYZ57991.1 MAG: thioredoxin [Hydrogenophilales bacterium 16-61-112]OZA44066.1 MAG: thioredoxin [Hydrogenophilales bacterium 17-61-76]HQT30815.1 thioredoxin [Thiobacillus sp.]HQT69619.1 thioredoxin [Thiobacillus sp.]